MKKIIYALCSLILVVTISCKNNTKEEKEATVPESKPLVYASNYPLFYFAEQIGGEFIDLKFSASEENDPSGWNPNAETIASMQEADLIFLNGATFEKWLMNVSISEEIKVNTSAKFDNDLLPLGEQFTHSHGDGGEHSHEGTASITWLDLSLALEQANAVKEALVKELPSKQEEFTSNFDQLSEKLTALDTGFKELNIDPDKIQLIYSHPVYQYLQNAYKLEGENLHWEPGDSWDQDRKHEMEHLADSKRKTFLIWEDEPAKETREALTKMGVESIIVEPLFSKSEKMDFIETAENNLANLKKIKEAGN